MGSIDKSTALHSLRLRPGTGCQSGYPQEFKETTHPIQSLGDSGDSSQERKFHPEAKADFEKLAAVLKPAVALVLKYLI